MQYSGGSLSTRPSVTASSPQPYVGQADRAGNVGAARDRLRQDIERRRDALDSEFQRLDAIEAELEDLDRQTDQIEGGLSYISIDDPEYERLIRRYNQLVAQYNTLRVDLESRRQSLQVEIDDFNAGLE